MDRDFTKLVVGEKVFIGQFYGSWGGPSYTRGVVQQVTPSGMVDVLIGHSTTPTRFNKDGRQRGASFGHGEQIDAMPFAEREADLDQRKRASDANTALVLVQAEKMRNPDKETLLVEADRLQKLLDAAKKLIEAV